MVIQRRKGLTRVTSPDFWNMKVSGQCRESVILGLVVMNHEMTPRILPLFDRTGNLMEHRRLLKNLMSTGGSSSKGVIGTKLEV